MFVARVAGGGAVALPAFPSRHSEGSTQNLPPLRQPDSWGPWAGSSGIQGTRPVSLPFPLGDPVLFTRDKA